MDENGSLGLKRQNEKQVHSDEPQSTMMNSEMLEYGPVGTKSPIELDVQSGLTKVEVPPGSLTAKQILQRVFGFTAPVGNDVILQRVRNDLESGRGTHFGSFLVDAKLISSAAGRVVERFRFDFQMLDDRDKYDVALTLRSGLKSYAEAQSGRPKGAKKEGTAWHIRLVAALRFLGCLRSEMMPFLYGAEQHIETRKQAFSQFLKRYDLSIKEEYSNLDEMLASAIVKDSITNELAEHIVSQPPLGPMLT